MKIIVALTLAALCASSQALTIDADKYFAYTQNRTGTHAISHKPCNYKKPYIKDENWRLSVTFYRGEEMNSCWRDDSPDDSIVICMYRPNEGAIYPNGRLGDCVDMPKSSFLDTANLPPRAKF